MKELAGIQHLEPMIQQMAQCPMVMLGEASHGTHEFYTWRTAISKKLISDHGYRFIAVEGDWPDCYLINRYVKGYADAGDNISSILQKFDRWPTWMWANWEIAALAEWLRAYNKTQPAGRKVGFYGLDVYSLWDSMKVMMDYLSREDQQTAAAVQRAIACFEPFYEDEHSYARHTLKHYNCRKEVVSLLKEIRTRAQYLDGDPEAGFNTEQNALIAVNAEKYYSSMIGFDNESWNIRDRHMMETMERLRRFHGPDARGIIWEHNTHIGDARATDMKRAGMVNTGQLARETYGESNVYLAGFGTYAGSVIAGEAWGAPMEEMDVPPAREDSIEAYLHDRYKRDGFFLFSENADTVFQQAMPHRAIGVVYHPAHEKRGNYVPSVMAKRYNGFIYLDASKALHPLHPDISSQKVPETYPFGT